MPASFLTLAQGAVAAAQADPLGASDLAAAKAAVNEAYLRVALDGTPWKFLEVESQWATTPGSDTYTYASIASAMSLTGGTIRDIVAMTDDTHGGRPLPSMSWEQLEELAAGTNTTPVGGVPVAWAKWGSRIRIYPVPAASVDFGVFLILKPTALSADGDTTLLPDGYDTSILIPYAAAILLEREGGSDAGGDMDRRMRRAEENIARLRTAYGSASRPSFNVVSPGAFADLDEDDLWVAV